MPAAATTKTTPPIPRIPKEDAEAAIQRFQQFLRFETVSATAPTTGAYKACAQFLLKELNDLPFLSNVHILKESPDHSPVVIACWKGKDSSLPILLLNSHYDVVPVDTSAWTVPAFDGFRNTEDGKIYGRGTQDMKCVCIQYIEALRYIHKTNSNQNNEWKPERDVLLTFVPDEEIGGAGMAAFLESTVYQSLPNGIALALDEGLASTTNSFDVFYGERLPWWIDVTATGPTGHGSRFIDNTAVEQLVELSKKALAFRQGQRDMLNMTEHENCTHAVARKNKTLGDVTSLNITTLQAGVRAGNTFAYNCVPPIAKCSLDIRISPHMQPKEMKGLLDLWCRECSKDPENGSQVSWKYIGEAGGGNDLQEHATTNTDRNMNPWYGAFCDALETDMGCTIVPQVFPAATDSRFLRALGIRALGFSPMRNTEIMLHENDEYIPEETFLEGIGVYAKLLHKLGSFKEE